MRSAARRPGALPVLLVALMVLGATAAAWSPFEVRAATAPLTMVTDTTYDILPEENRVAVTVRIAATSQLRDTTTRRYYTDRAYLAVPPRAANLRLTAGKGTPSVSVMSRTATSAILLLKFGSQLGAGKTTELTLTFDIVDEGGEPDRAFRISPSLVSMTAWAFGTDGVAGSTVRVRLPAGYVATIGRGPLSGPSTEPDGHVVYASEVIASPGAYVADVMADRPGVLDNLKRSTSVGARTVTLLLRSWPDDPAWRARVFDILSRGLPALGTAIGVDWQIDPTLEVRETIVRAEGAVSSAGSAGAAAFDPSVGRLDIPYTADPTAILHGAAHGWFNASLVVDRWVAEGFAALYAEQAGAAIGIAVRSPAMTEAALDDSVPLNAWVVGGPNDNFGHAASLELARSIAERAGPAALQAVWRDVADGIRAYRPIDPDREGSAAEPERGGGPVDWRSLLDLFEEQTGTSFEGLWRAWVVRQGDTQLLDARAAARRMYEQTVAAAAPWVLPKSIRDAMRAWRFDDATAQMRTATEVIGQRENLVRAARAAGLQLPDALRKAFEGTEGIQSAAAEALTEQAVIDSIETTLADEPTNPGPITRIGLIGKNPGVEITAARAAFAAGDLDATVRRADAARAIWTSAEEVGRGRVASAATIAFAVAAFLWVLVSRRRTIRRRPR
ncbi:MAG: hypothetical protein HYX54_08550 [Chloroflexi bacterium]|nr:hypothetical protein [Chloroflexota bacterium]